jgi:hypothetical protein
MGGMNPGGAESLAASAALRSTSVEAPKIFSVSNVDQQK